jgi:drug/metabolite transporter (DMT)-like permease
MKAKNLILLLIPVLPVLLVSAQTIWATGVRRHHLFSGTPHQILFNLLTSVHIWMGATLYIGATLVHLFLLSRLRFFSVTVSVTVLAVVLSTLVSVLIFKEQFSYTNLAGAILVLIGLPLVLMR